MKKAHLLGLLVSLLAVSLTSCMPEPPRDNVPKTNSIPETVKLSRSAIERFGVKIIAVGQRSDVQTISSTGEIKADENRVFHINSLSGGRVISDNVMLGDVIRPGQTLAIVQNLDVAKIYGDYIHQAHDNEIQVHLSETRLALAKKNYDRLKGLYQENIVAEKDFLKAQSDKDLEEEILAGNKEHSTHIKEEAKAMLAAYGVTLSDNPSEHVLSSSPITTPRGGVIIKKSVTVGDVVSNTEPLYVVGDLSHVWLDIAVYDKQLQSIREGDPITFTSDSLPGRTITSRISYIKPSTDGSTGTFVARAMLDNPSMDLKPGMLGQVRIQNHSGSLLAFIPDEALQTYGKEQFVFLAQDAGCYKKQLVDVGKPVAGGYVITRGLKPGQQIVGRGSFTLKAEMLKGTLVGED